MPPALALAALLMLAVIALSAVFAYGRSLGRSEVQQDREEYYRQGFAAGHNAGRLTAEADAALRAEHPDA